jgi:hypothetical protein
MIQDVDFPKYYIINQDRDTDGQAYKNKKLLPTKHGPIIKDVIVEPFLNPYSPSSINQSVQHQQGHADTEKNACHATGQAL